jgi:hypothetical protein
MRIWFCLALMELSASVFKSAAALALSMALSDALIRLVYMLLCDGWVARAWFWVCAFSPFDKLRG